MTPHDSATQHIRLDANDKDRQVFITAANEDRFYVPMPEAVRRIQIGESRHAWTDELNAMLRSVYEWAHGNVRGLIAGCFAAPCDGVITIFVVPKSGRFDFDLADQLTALDLFLARDFQAVPTEIVQIPGDTEERLDQFVDTTIAVNLLPEA